VRLNACATFVCAPSSRTLWRLWTSPRAGFVPVEIAPVSRCRGVLRLTYDGDGAADMSNSCLADPVAEARRTVERAGSENIVLRAIGGVAVAIQCSPEPLLQREIRDIDLVTRKGNNKAIAKLFLSLGYLGDEEFNAFHGHSRQVYVDLSNRRKVDVFVGDFNMCHRVPIADRLDRDPLTVPLAELLMTKLQIFELNERDERDIYNLCFHHGVGDSGIEAGLIARLCARDWGFWRTSKRTIERCQQDLGSYDLASGHRDLIANRLQDLWDRIEREPKSSRWRMRNRVGDRVRWYEEPEEETEEQRPT
jgi:hypothetical protein